MYLNYIDNIQKKSTSLTNFLNSDYDGVFYIGHASILVRLNKKKYIFDAIKNSQNQNISLDCIGRYEEKYLNKLNTKYNFKKLNIRVRKNISYKDIIKTYKNYDALIFPSLCESFGLPVLEAAANNLPVLCSDLKVFREIYGEGCFYFDPRSSKSILNKIYYFISLKNNEIIKKTKLNYSISKNLNWNFCGNNYYKTILDTLNFYEKKN